ncbi:MAG: hypothetical protein ACUVTX_05460 [Bacteroidales bacterium]
MKRIVLFVVFLSFVLRCLAQESDIIQKKGWNIGFLPAVAYDSDLGIYYGIIINPFDYGDGSVCPNYLQSVYLQVSGYSKGSSEHAIEYESYSFLPNVRFTAKFKYLGYKAYPFYGYNDNKAIYHPEWETGSYFGPPDKSLHKSLVGGLKLAMNENFVMSAEYAVLFDREDGVSELYPGLNYQFKKRKAPGGALFNPPVKLKPDCEICRLA